MRLVKTVDVTDQSSSPDIEALIARLKAPIEEFVLRYSTRRSAIMPALTLAQAECGYLSREAMEAVADILGIAPVQVYEIATFYSMYHTEKKGKHHIQVCTNVSCMLLGAERLLSHIEQRLGIKTGESTPDGFFSLSAVECLGSCNTAPVMQVNNEPYHENLSEERIDKVIETLRQKPTESRHV